MATSIFKKLKYIYLLLLICLVSACGSNDNDPPKSNQGSAAPIVNAGHDQEINELTMVSLLGQVQSDNSTSTRFKWRQISGPSVEIINANSQTASFLAPDVDANDILTFELEVTDSNNIKSTDQVSIKVSNLNSIDIQLAKEPPLAKGTWSQLELELVSTFNIASIVWKTENPVSIQTQDESQNKAIITVPYDFAADEIKFIIVATDNTGFTHTKELELPITAAPTFVEYTEEQDTIALENIDIVAIAADSNTLTPANRLDHGYLTHVFDQQAQLNLIPKKGSLHIESGELSDIQIGDVIVGITADGKQGFMREVLAVENSNIITQPAPLNKAFPNADVKITLNVSNTNTNSVVKSKRVDHSQSQKASFEPAKLQFERTLQHKFSEEVTSVVELKMDSSVEINIDFSIIEGKVKRFSTIAKTDYQTKSYLKVDYESQSSLTREKLFKSLINKNLKVLVGPIPLLLNLNLQPKLVAQAASESKAYLKVGLNAYGNYQAGFEYANEQIKNINEISPSLSGIGPIYDLAATATAKINAELGVVISAYEISTKLPVLGKVKLDGPGVGVAMGPYADFIVNSELNDQTAKPKCHAQMNLGLDVDANLDYGFLGFLLAVEEQDKQKTINLYNTSKPIWTSDECPFEPSYGHLEGQITNTEGQPINGAALSLKNTITDRSFSLNSDEKGLFAANNLEAGKYTIIAKSTGYQADKVIFDVKKDDTKTLYLTLFAGDNNDDDQVEDGHGNSKKSASVMGDPHLRTFDGVQYGFHGVGEYILTKSDVDNFEVQARYIALEGRNSVSFTGAVAVNIEDTRLTFYPSDTGLAVLKDGELITLEQKKLALPNQAIVQKHNTREYTLQWQDGSMMQVIKRAKFIDLNITLNNQRSGTMHGLLGHFDGNVDNDLVDAQGTPLEDKSNFNELYDSYGNSWRVNGENTLFDYFNDETLESFVDLNYPRTLMTPARLMAQIGQIEYQRIKLLCEQYVTQKARLDACILDSALTGDTSALDAYRLMALPKASLEITVPPTLTLTSPSPGAILSSNILISGDVQTEQADIQSLALSVNGAEKVDISFALSAGTFQLTQAAEQFIEGENSIIVYATDTNGNTANTIVGFTFDKGVAPLAGSDLIVFNDVNILDNTRITLGDNTQFAENLVNFTGQGARSKGTKILFDRAHNSRCSTQCTSLTGLYRVWENLGFEVITAYNQDSWDLSDPLIKTIILWIPQIPYTDTEISQLKQFAAEGGRIVFVGEHEGYYRSEGIALENAFLEKMGAYMRNIGKDVYGGNTYFSKNEDNTHQVMHQVDTLVFNRVSLLSLGPNDYPLVTSDDGLDVIAGVARININQSQIPTISVNKKEATKRTKFKRPSPIISNKTTD
ncbi:VWD domain-containing protein [Pseudoalteromonas aurantia]|uniref:VWFD domain-containing protein n=3 Tax=Pseudoalteromonas TaxID=53246 RepID=A0ABY2VZT8_9GAMM|nr:VWD domain-containing protein [Pseudoalteromonas aurantia]TMO60652.1 hypothetical protein CWC18_13405 [Pseudoalteromonas aurantia]TMO76079.1 hypothetical protein CWC20_06140 [Pseudoalteromonas aurantia]